MPALTRGPLPARVYWVRRSLVLGTAVLLVFAIGRLLAGGSDASGGDSARLAAGAPSTTKSRSAPATTAPAPRRTVATTTAPALAVPNGVCAGSDLAVTPDVTRAVAGRDVMVVLQVRTLRTPACTWRLGPESLAVRVTSGQDRIWASADCPHAVPRRDVVVRQAVTTTVGVVWRQAKRSDESCIARTGWALPGWYHVTAAAVGGEPSDVQFELATPTAVTITRTATPKQQPSKQPSKQPSRRATPSRTPSGSPSHSPSGAVAPH